METKTRCQFLYDIDLFGKVPELYFQGKPKKPTELGIVLTLLYIILYIGFLIYKLIPFSKREDVTFYDTYIYKDFPYINVTNEEFYGGFMLGTGIDETIYYPEVRFIYKVKTPTGFEIEKIDELEVEVCNISNFGKRYRETFKDKNLENLYCIKNFSGTFEGYSNLDRYSYISMQFYPCINKTRDGRDCKPEEYLRAYLTTNMIEFRMQDNLLSPEIYNEPVQVLEKDINTPVFLSLYQYIYTYIQIVILETDDDISGIKFWEESKVEKYPIYDESYIITAPPNGDILKTGGAICEVTLQLAAKVLTIKRKYKTLLDVLGEVGGFMKVVYTVFELLSQILTDISYKKFLVNNLFYFDLSKKIIYIKKITKSNIKLTSDEIMDSFIKERNNYNKIKINQSDKINLNENSLNLKNNNNLNSLFNFRQKKFSNPLKNEDIKSDTHRPIIVSKANNFNELNTNLGMRKANIYQRNKVIKNEEILENINLNIFCYYCLKKKKNMDINLLEEGMKVISEKLDIMNLFTKIYQDEKVYDKLLVKVGGVKMSTDCVNNLDIIKKINDNKKNNNG